MFLLGNAREQIDDGLIGLASFGRKARQGAAKIVAFELRGLVDFAGEEALAERAVSNEANAEFFQCRNHFGFRPAEPD